MKKSLKAVAALSAAALLLAGCAGTTVDGDTSDSGGALAAAPGFDPDTKTIRIGSLVPVSGIWAGAVANVQAMEAYFAQATAAGGPLEGYTIELENQDSEYDPAVAIPLFNGMKDDVAMFSMLLGSHIMSAILPTMEEDGLIGVPAGIGPLFLRAENLIPTFPLNNTYHAAAVDYYHSVDGNADKTYCSLTVEDVLGDGIKEATDFAFDDLDVDLGTEVRYAAGTEDFTAQVTELKNAGCDVVVIGGVGLVVQQFAIKAVQLGFNPDVLTSNVAYNITLATGPGADWIGEHVIVAVTGDEWDGDQAPGQAEMVAALSAGDSEVVPTANAYQTGWVNAALTVDILAKAIDSGDMSRANILKIATTELGEVDDMGMAGGAYDYGSSVADRTPPHLMSFFAVNADVPAGLELLEYNYESSVVADYVATVE